METSGTWFFWALLSAVFAALTAVFAKIGLTGIDSDLATLVRTGIIAVVLAAFVAGTGKWTNPLTLPTKTLLFLLLSGLATGASWVCYFRALKVGEASKVAPVDKLSVVLVAVFAVLFLHERPSVRGMVGHPHGRCWRVGLGPETLSEKATGVGGRGLGTSTTLHACRFRPMPAR
jgi:transporter family protein